MPHRSRRFMETLVAILLTTLAVVAGAGMVVRALEDGAHAGARSGAGPLRITVSIAPQAWLVERIGGDAVEVSVLVPPGASPATYQPTDAQVTAVMRGDALLRIGVPFEGGRWFGALERGGGVRIIDQADGVTRRTIEAHHHHHDDHGHDHDHAHDHAHDHGPAPDPHVWTSPRALVRQAENVTRMLAELRPGRRAAFEANLERVKAELAQLDVELGLTLAPFRGRTVLVFHPAWGYLLDAYGLTQVAVEIGGRSPTDAELTELQTIARAAGTRTVFVQPQIRGRAAEAVAAAIDGGVEVIDPLARDVPANLRAVTRKIATALREATP